MVGQDPIHEGCLSKMSLAQDKDGRRKDKNISWWYDLRPEIYQ
jgi:hypothetical protein